MTGSCPDCNARQEVSGSVTTCANADCELVAPTSAFTTTAESSNQAPMAFTLGGNVD